MLLPHKGQAMQCWLVKHNTHWLYTNGRFPLYVEVLSLGALGFFKLPGHWGQLQGHNLLWLCWCLTSQPQEVDQPNSSSTSWSTWKAQNTLWLIKHTEILPTEINTIHTEEIKWLVMTAGMILINRCWRHNLAKFSSTLISVSHINSALLCLLVDTFSWLSLAIVAELNHLKPYKIHPKTNNL